MAKNLGVILIMFSVLAGGIGYVIYSAPELPEHQLFNLAIKHFSQNAASLEQQFIKSGSISAEEKQLTIKYLDLNKAQATLLVKMSVANNQAILAFGEGNTAFAFQTIILEPYFPRGDMAKKNIYWKCIGGSVLVRFRSKVCRLGPGIDTSEILAE